MAQKKQTKKSSTATQKTSTEKSLAKKRASGKASAKKSTIKTRTQSNAKKPTKASSQSSTKKKTTAQKAAAKKPTKQQTANIKSVAGQLANQKSALQKVVQKKSKNAKKDFKKPGLLAFMKANFKHSFKTVVKDNERAIKRKRTGKEIAVIAISIIMVVSILLPSFTMLFGGDKTKTPSSFSQTNEIYQPKIDELQRKIADNPSSATDQLALADTTYRYGQYAMQYASTDDEETQAKSIMQAAAAEYAAYLALAGSLETYEEKNAVVSRAFCNLYVGNDDEAIQQLQDLLKETNFAPAWQALGMIYESKGKNNQAIEAYQKAIDAPQDSKQDVTPYCQSRIKALKDENAQSSGGAPALNAQLNS